MINKIKEAKERLSTPSLFRPAFIRLPASGEREMFSGLTRDDLYRLLKKGLIRSKTVMIPGATKPKRLIDLQSVLDWIDAQAEEDLGRRPK